MIYSNHADTMSDIIGHLREGRKIEAIKRYRMVTGAGLREAKEACDVLGAAVKRAPAPTPKADPMAGRVLVVDSKNPDRVLGSVERPRGNSPRLDGGDCYNMAVMSRISCAPFDPCTDTLATASVSHVRFGFRCVNWNVVLTTDASLELLVRLDSFRLPGEDAEQAHVRHMYTR